MDGLILCRSEEAAKPYYMSSLGLNVYSLEELCYAIYNNIYLLGNDFVDDALIDFIRNDTGDLWLANELKALKARDAGLRELVITILLDVDYYTGSEVDDLRGLIDNLVSLGIEERLKRRADNFLANHKYESAIKHYAAILNQDNHSMKDDFYGNVLHNIAVCYSKLFLFEQAAQCFKSAYELNENTETLSRYYMACQLSGIKPEDEYYNEELMNECIAQMDELSKKIMDSEEYLEVAQIAKLRTDGSYTEYNQKLNRIFNKWKAEYTLVSV